MDIPLVLEAYIHYENRNEHKPVHVNEVVKTAEPLLVLAKMNEHKTAITWSVKLSKFFVVH